MMKFLRTIKTDKSGASAAEYALLVALVAVAIIGATQLLGSSISGVFTNAASAISKAS